jgi:hypothetical protein
VVPRRRDEVDAIECKWNVDAFETRGMVAFRENYPQGRNLLISPQITTAYSLQREALRIEFVPIAGLREMFGV